MSKQLDLKTNNNKLDKLLNVENRTALMEMVVYLRAANISDYQVELVRQDLLDMALRSQSRNEPLSGVIGSSYQSFCDEIIRNVEHRAIMQNFIQWLMILSLSFSILVTQDVVFSGYLSRVYHSLSLHSSVDTSYPISAGFLMNTVVIAGASYLIVYLIGKYTFQTKTMHAIFSAISKPKRFGFGFLAGAALMGYFFGIAQLDKFVLFSTNIIIYPAILLTFFVIYKINSKIGHAHLL